MRCFCQHKKDLPRNEFEIPDVEALDASANGVSPFGAHKEAKGKCEKAKAGKKHLIEAAE